MHIFSVFILLNWAESRKVISPVDDDTSKIVLEWANGLEIQPPVK